MTAHGRPPVAAAERDVGALSTHAVALRQGEYVQLGANADHWDGEPTIDSLIFRPIPEVSSRMAALQSGDVQIAVEIPTDLLG